MTDSIYYYHSYHIYILIYITIIPIIPIYFPITIYPDLRLCMLL